MRRTIPRCPACSSVVVLEREHDGVTAVCLGCARRWELPPPALLEGERERAAIRADPSFHRPGRPRKNPALATSSWNQ